MLKQSSLDLPSGCVVIQCWKGTRLGCSLQVAVVTGWIRDVGQEWSNLVGQQLYPRLVVDFMTSTCRCSHTISMTYNKHTHVPSTVPFECPKLSSRIIWHPGLSNTSSVVEPGAAGAQLFRIASLSPKPGSQNPYAPKHQSRYSTSNKAGHAGMGRTYAGDQVHEVM